MLLWQICSFSCRKMLSRSTQQIYREKRRSFDMQYLSATLALNVCMHQLNEFVFVGAVAMLQPIL